MNTPGIENQLDGDQTAKMPEAGRVVNRDSVHASGFTEYKVYLKADRGDENSFEAKKAPSYMCAKEEPLPPYPKDRITEITKVPRSLSLEYLLQTADGLKPATRSDVVGKPHWLILHLEGGEEQIQIYDERARLAKIFLIARKSDETGVEFYNTLFTGSRREANLDRASEFYEEFDAEGKLTDRASSF